MSRNFSIIIIFLALLPLVLYLFIQQSDDTTEDIFTMNGPDKSELINYSYHVLNDYFNQGNLSIIEYPMLKDDKTSYNILFITLLNNGKVRGCQSGSTEKDHKDRLFLDIKEALVESIEDEGFGGTLKENEISNVEVMFTFLYDINWLYNKSMVFLQNNIELGIHSIEILSNNTPFIFKESVAISHNYDLETLIIRLCHKAGLQKDGYLNDEVTLFRYETYTFKGNHDGEITELYRYGILIDEENITNDMIYDSIESGYSWFLHSINNKTNLLEYEYYPSDDYYSIDNNNVRQLASLWSLTELTDFLVNDSSKVLIHNTINYYLQYINQTQNEFLFLTINNQSKLANSAFLLMSLINTKNFDNRSFYIDKLTNGILSLQQENGSFYTYFFSDKNTGIDYYPGEAMLSLIKTYQETADQRLLQSVQNGYNYYKEYWRNNKNTAFIPWHTQTYSILFNITKEKEVIDFIFEMNDWIIDNYQIQESKFIDEIGGFPLYYPTFSTSVFLEGINDAYALAIEIEDSYHIKKYKESLTEGTRFVLQTQFNDENSFYVENKTKSVGGFKTSLTKNTIRIDNVQHAVLTLMKTYNNGIFSI